MPCSVHRSNQDPAAPGSWVPMKSTLFIGTYFYCTVSVKGRVTVNPAPLIPLHFWRPCHWGSSPCCQSLAFWSSASLRVPSAGSTEQHTRLSGAIPHRGPGHPAGCRTPQTFPRGLTVDTVVHGNYLETDSRRFSWKETGRPVLVALRTHPRKSPVPKAWGEGKPEVFTATGGPTGG